MFVFFDSLDKMTEIRKTYILGYLQSVKDENSVLQEGGEKSQRITSAI